MAERAGEGTGILTERELGDLLGDYYPKFEQLPERIREMILGGIEQTRDLNRAGGAVMESDESELGDIEGLGQFHRDALTAERGSKEFPAEVYRSFVDLGAAEDAAERRKALEVCGGVPLDYARRFETGGKYYRDALDYPARISVETSDQVNPYLVQRDGRVHDMLVMANQIGSTAGAINDLRSQEDTA